MFSRFPTTWPLRLGIALASGCNHGSHVALPSSEPVKLGVDRTAHAAIDRESLQRFADPPQHLKQVHNGCRLGPTIGM